MAEMKTAHSAKLWLEDGKRLQHEVFFAGFKFTNVLLLIELDRTIVSQAATRYPNEENWQVCRLIVQKLPWWHEIRILWCESSQSIVFFRARRLQPISLEKGIRGAINVMWLATGHFI